MFSDVTGLQQRDHRLSTEGKIVSKYCNISKSQERGSINAPTPLYQGGYQGGGRTLSVGPRVKVKWFSFSYSRSHLKDKKKATVICLKDVDWWDEEHLGCSVSHWVYSDNYNQRLHSHCLCKKPPSTQTQYVPDNEPNCSWFVHWSRRGTWNRLVY